MTKTRTIPANIIASLRNRKNRGSATVDGVLTEGEGEGEGLRVASYNVHKCVGVDGKFDPARIAHVIREINPDVIALQEADTRFGERRGLLDLHWIERETGLCPVPISGISKAHGWHGNVLFFRNGAVRDVHPVKLPGLEPRGALLTELELADGTALRVVAAHLGLLNRSRQSQARMILDLLRLRDDQPTLLMGDLNEWRLGNRSSLNSLASTFRGMPSAVPSFPSRLPVLALDRIMCSHEGLIEKVHVHDTALARVASDHLPIKALLRTSGQ
ncbi:endonuclease/exonuclease/phosphatase family protein [Rhizobium lemnae]|uniref:Endonuclease/exonuclease/phosphatase family protein n=1 Tax=Rhizobium lemnae TaxID=1214924 RepID=A0ABV8ECX9_9HYPH|nr:endonuclease/exonuclease/phosphatase family protein [Rhizobium lemnae]MCJ8509966.1 endonuclease/exonuclease/phosphatase family protein [Rhizobium lemnae]